MFLIMGGCYNGKGPDAGQKDTVPQRRKIAFEPFDLSRAPSQVSDAAKTNKAKGGSLLLEDQGRFWVLLARGEKPTGGYGIRVTNVVMETDPNGKRKLEVTYEHIDPQPGQFVTQALTYPMELVWLKGLQERPDEVRFIN